MEHKAISTQSSISKNSAALFIRMLLRLFVSLYTTRVILNALGIDDYGIYNVIAGFTVMFSFVNTSMSTAISRFLAYDLGKNGLEKRLEETFRLAFSAQVVLGMMVVLLAELLGLPIINYYLSIPKECLYSANILYQCTIVSLIFNMIQVPFNATIIALERMNVYAYIEILYVVLLLFIALILQIITGPLLIYYGLMLVGVNFCIFLLYYVYTRQFGICTPKFMFNWERMKPMVIFSGADFYSNCSLALQAQGQNVIINKFFGIVANAAVGVANQVYGALLMFSASITTAIRPRIIKLYAAGDYNAFQTLIFDGSRIISFFNIIICIPLIYIMQWILPLWLEKVPEYAVLFAQILLLNHSMFCYKPILITGIHATGNIKAYSLVSGTWNILSVGVQYMIAVLGCGVEFVYASFILFTCIYVIIINRFLSKLTDVDFRGLIRQIVIPGCVVTLAMTFLGYYILNNLSFTLEASILLVILLTLLCVLISAAFILNNRTRTRIWNFAKIITLRSKS